MGAQTALQQGFHAIVVPVGDDDFSLGYVREPE
jgi:hypothetical protein